MGAQDSMPRGADDLLKRVAELEAKMKQVTALAASAAAVKQTLVTGAVGEASNTNFPSTSGYTTYASFNLTVPAGYTRALIVASAFVNLNTNSGGSDRNFCTVYINGSAGPESIGYIYSVAGPASAYHVASLTGLTAGASIPILVQGHLQVGSNNSLFQQWNSATVVASAAFLS